MSVLARVQVFSADVQLMQAIEKLVAEQKFGRANAVKRGRNPKYPWVPIIDYGEQTQGVHTTRTEQIRKLAFAEREDAVNAAQKVIDARRDKFRHDLLEPRMRALRQQYNLPRDI